MPRNREVFSTGIYSEDAEDENHFDCHEFDTSQPLEDANLLIVSNGGVPKVVIDQDGNISAGSINGIDPASQVFASGSFTTAGGDANESITVTGALSSDLAFVQMHTLGLTPRTLLTAQSASNAINLVFSDDPSTDHVVKWMLLRASS